MINHQTSQGKAVQNLTVLKKVGDKYTWKRVDFPASFDDITTFEENNKESVFVYGLNKKQEI